MKLLMLIFLFLITIRAYPQTPANNIVEGGKLLVELVKVMKRPAGTPSRKNISAAVSDICYTNATTDPLTISLSKKISDTMYISLPVSLNLAAGAHECLLALLPGVYHFKIHKLKDNIFMLSSEGDLLLKSNEKMEREIK